jgi:hypothetical protein
MFRYRIPVKFQAKISFCSQVGMKRITQTNRGASATFRLLSPDASSIIVARAGTPGTFPLAFEKLTYCFLFWTQVNYKLECRLHQVPSHTERIVHFLPVPDRFVSWTRRRSEYVYCKWQMVMTFREERIKITHQYDPVHNRSPWPLLWSTWVHSTCQQTISLECP